MFDLLTFVLSDYNCPHCLRSLRFRFLKSKDIPATPLKNSVIATSYDLCPHCGGKVKSSWHPAVFNEWMWSKRLAPGILIWIVAMIMDFDPVLMMVGQVVLVIGFAAVLHYMVTERWQRPYYFKFEDLVADPNSIGDDNLPSA